MVVIAGRRGTLVTNVHGHKPLDKADYMAKPTDNLPLYQGIIDDIVSRIRRGELGPGDRLPPIERMADDYNVSSITVKRAVSELKISELISAVPGRGTFVTEHAGRIGRQKGTEIGRVVLMTSNPDFTQRISFFTEIWNHINLTVKELGLELGIRVIPDIPSRFELDKVFHPGADEGILFHAPAYPYGVLELLREHRTPLVLIDSLLPFAHAALTDNLHGIHDLILHLRAFGHTHLLLATNHPESPNMTNENERLAAFRFFIDHYQLQASYAQADDMERILNLAKEQEGPTAIMFTQDEGAYECIEAAKAAGLRIPEDISVTGFDGARPAVGHIEGDLTTIVVNFAGIGRTAVESLVEISKQPELPATWHRLRGRLFVGPSTGPVHA